MGGWEICLGTSLAYGSLVSTAFGDSCFILDFTTYSLMSDVNVQLHFVCCNFRFDFRYVHSDISVGRSFACTCDVSILQILSLAYQDSFGIWKFGYFFLRFLNFTGSLEIIDTEFYTSSGVRAQQLERPALHNPFDFTISGQSPSHVFEDTVFHSCAGHKPF